MSGEPFGAQQRADGELEIGQKLMAVTPIIAQSRADGAVRTWEMRGS